MQLWFYEDQSERLRIGLKVRETLYRTRTEFQDLAVLDTYEFGRMLVLDGMVMFTEFDEFAYHEMIIHVPLCLHPNPRNILVVGGGDGGSVREILRHPSVQRVVLCEIDREVVEVARKFFPRLSCQLDDPRVEILYQDAIEYVKNPGQAFDVAIIDSTDPIGPALGLFTQSFYSDLHQCLGPDGIVVAQSEAFYLRPDHIRSIHKKFSSLFKHVAVYGANIPTYPTGYWSFTLGSKTRDPLNDWSQERAAELEPDMRYYNREIHRSAFALPTFFHKWLNV
jgi:spermidine synthase